MKIGYIGLGALGGALAQRFLEAHELTVWDLDRRAMDRLAARGATPAASGADLARRVDIVFTCLPRSADVRQALFGADGVAEGLSSGKLVIDQSSGIPAETRAMADELGRRGVAMIDAAVSASPALAAQGGARLMIAGPDDAIERARAALAVLSATVYRCGRRVGDGQAMKTVNNAMNAGCRLGTLEVVAMARKAGLTLPALSEVLNKGTARNLTTVSMLPALIEGKASTDFALSLMLKDLDQALALGMQVGAPMPLAAGVRGLLQIGVNTLGPAARLEDVVKLIESMAGTRIAQPGETALEVPVAATPAAKPTLGYVGVGEMGGAIARRLLQRGYRVHVFDVRAENARACAAEGAIVAADLAAIARDCDVVLTCVPTPEIFREVVLGAGGLAAHLARGKVLIDQTTGMPPATRAIGEVLRERGLTFVDAPVSGGPPNAVNGTLTVMCGGTPEAFASVRTILQSMGSEIVYCGPLGNGHAAKLANNAVAALARLVTYECVTAGYKYGLALPVMAEVLNTSSGWSNAARRVFELLLEGKGTNAGLWLPVKDLKLAERLAAECGAPMMLAAGARNIMEMALNELGPSGGTNQLPGVYERMGGTRFDAARAS